MRAVAKLNGIAGRTLSSQADSLASANSRSLARTWCLREGRAQGASSPSLIVIMLNAQ